jgi:hypothetical protein
MSSFFPGGINYQVGSYILMSHCSTGNDGIG